MPHLIIYSLSRHEPEGTALVKKEITVPVKGMEFKNMHHADDTLIVWLDGKLIHHQPGIHNYDACPIHPGSAYFLGNECEVCRDEAMNEL